MLKKMATHGIMLAVGLGAGIGGVALAAPQPTAHTAAADSRIVTQLQAMNKQLMIINKSLTGRESSAPFKPLSDQLKYICQNTSNIDGAYNNAVC